MSFISSLSRYSIFSEVPSIHNMCACEEERYELFMLFMFCTKKIQNVRKLEKERMCCLDVWSIVCSLSSCVTSIIRYLTLKL